MSRMSDFNLMSETFYQHCTLLSEMVLTDSWLYNLDVCVNNSCFQRNTAYDHRLYRLTRWSVSALVSSSLLPNDWRYRLVTGNSVTIQNIHCYIVTQLIFIRCIKSVYFNFNSRETERSILGTERNDLRLFQFTRYSTPVFNLPSLLLNYRRFWSSV